MSHPLTRPVVALYGLVGTTLLLHLAGSVVTAPPLELTGLAGWWIETDPLEAFAGTARILALATCYWLILVTVLGLFARALGARPLERLTRRLAPAAWRTLVLRPLAATVVVAPQVVVPAATMATVAAAPEPVVGIEEAPAPDPGPIVIEMRQATSPDAAAAASGDHDRTQSAADAEAVPTTVTDEAIVGHELGGDATPDVSGETGTDGPDVTQPAVAEASSAGPSADAHTTGSDDTSLITMRAGRGSETPDPGPTPVEIEDDPSGPVSHGRDGTAGAGPVLVMETPEPSPESVDDTGRIHVVAPGEHLWSIAVARLTDSTGRTPSAREVAPYWRELVELNRAGLPDPDNPDLLLPGVELRLPPVG